MFNRLYHHFLSQKQQFNHDYQHATLEELDHAIREANALRKKETSDRHYAYDEANTNHYLITMLLLNDLYCRKMPPIEDEAHLKKWQELEQKYTYLEARLIQGQAYSAEEEKYDEVASEVTSLNDYLRETSLKGDIESFIAQTPTRGEMGDFLRLMAAVKKDHFEASLTASTYQVSYLTETYEKLTQQLIDKQNQLIVLNKQHEELKAQNQQLEESNTWVYQWGLQVANKQANGFQRLVIWAFNFFTSEPIQDRARMLGKKLWEADSKVLESTQNIRNVNSEVKSLRESLESTTNALNDAKQKHAEIIKSITPATEAGAAFEETDTPEPFHSNLFRS
ncbi:hypothetical protein [Legionella erythra]|uniref:Uncharacterized protein n=1 Tax=Legionella erythra TaxID=448 RepID=A0A0W0TJQ3_LEGER|nr:hypothetical protein [Legionella erythra]KTC95786.1 hypothetical protein Lery_2081 [Legionella erythra]